MSRWFRFYDEALNDPKVQRLPGDLFKVWVNILCIASKSGGVLKSVGDVAFGLRVSDARAGQLVALLARGGPGERLLDPDPAEGGYFRPHNWEGRQYKSDTSNERVAAFRKRAKKQECNVTEAVTVTPPEQSRAEQSRNDDDAERGAPLALAEPLKPAPQSTIGKEAIEIAGQIGKLLGHDPDFVPPAFYGAPYRIQYWINQGWPKDVVLASVAEQIAKKRGDKPNRVEYFEPGIASAIARQKAPLPTVNVIPGKTIEVSRETTATAKSGLAAIDRVFERLAAQGSGGEPGGLAIEHEDAVLRLSN